MASSLSISGLIELLGGGVPSTLAQCAGAYFRLASQNGTGYDLSVPVPTADYVASLILDGEKPSGRRASNRTITLPVWIIAPDPDTLVAARETLLQAADQDTWRLTWTRDGGDPLVFDCFRAQPSVVQYGLIYSNHNCSLVTLTIPAKPYGRSDTVTEVAFASPVTGAETPAIAVTLDDYATVSSPGFTASARAVTGTQSAYWAATGSGFPTYSATFGSPKDLTGLTAIAVWLGLGTGSSDAWYNWHKGPVQVQYTLTDSRGATISFGRAPHLVASNNNLQPSWKLVSVPVPSDLTGFDITQVAGYTIAVRNYFSRLFLPVQTTAVYLNHLQAVPQTGQVPAAIRGWVYTLYSVLGSARAPLNLQAQQAPVSTMQTDVLTGSGVWVPPAGVTSVLAECWGAGGAGGTRTTSGQGGGGGGGEYAAEPSYAIPPGTPVPYSCGQGGTPAGISSAPSSATYTSGGTAQWKCPAGVTSVQVQAWGGGGGGGYADSVSLNAGGGGGGEYASDTVPVTAGHTYTVTVGQGGQRGGPNEYSAAGTDSFFNGDTGSVRAHGGQRGTGSSRGTGGTGSTAATHHNGGSGGPAVSGLYGGGGGSSAGTSAAGGTGGTGTGSGVGAGGTAPSGGGNGGVGGGNASGPGIHGFAPGGGGGGAGPEGVTSPGNGGPGSPGKIVLTWTAFGTGSPAVNGTSSTFGLAGSVVTAHGGASVAANTTAGTAGASGSSATTHHNGGAGAAASGAGGGGGAGADSTGTGVAGSGSTGGNSALDGGDGGNGATSANTAGAGGNSPGGGGGGADSTGTAVSGGGGADGQVQVTYTRTLQPFQTLIAHRPGPDAPQSLLPFVSFGGSDAPDGTVEYPVPSKISGVNARFGATYTLWLVAYSWDSSASPRTVTLQVNQYEYSGGPVVSDSVSRTFIPDNDASNGMIPLGELTLPVSRLTADNTSAIFTVTCTSGNVNDLYLDVLFIDTMGQTVVISTENPYNTFFIDAPDDISDLGNISGSYYDRSQATSVLASTLASSGGPLFVEPGDVDLFCYAREGAPALYASYYAAYWVDRKAV